jgi:hypothetical protein
VSLTSEHPGGSEHIVVELQGGAHLMTPHQASSLVGHARQPSHRHSWPRRPSHPRWGTAPPPPRPQAMAVRPHRPGAGGPAQGPVALRTAHRQRPIQPWGSVLGAALPEGVIASGDGPGCCWGKWPRCIAGAFWWARRSILLEEGVELGLDGIL